MDHMLSKLKLIILLFSILFVDVAYAQTQLTDIEQNSNKISRYYQAEKLELPFDAVINLATQIIRQRKKYDPNTLAKTYALLADIAEIKGESPRSFQLASYGLTYKPIEAQVKLHLKLKLAAGYFFNNEYAVLVKYIEDIVLLSQKENNKEYIVIALAYRAMANAFLGMHKSSLEDLLAVEKIIESNEELVDHIEVYEILAISQCYLGNGDVALSLYDRILDKRFKINKLTGIETTYAQLAQVYLKMNLLDDALNAFWESKNYALQFQLPIRAAYADLGIGKVMLKQKRYEAAFKSLIEAENLFKGQNLNGPYLDTLIQLIKASKNTEREAYAQTLLLQAKEIANMTKFAPELPLLNKLLADYYEERGESENALKHLRQHVQLIEKANNNKAIAIKKAMQEQQKYQSKFQALKVVEVNENRNSFLKKINKQQQVVNILILLCLSLIFIIVLQWLKIRSQKLNFIYDQNQRPEHFLIEPIETKQLYQRVYKKARKYQYPLSVGYIEIKNWSDLSFKYNKKAINEVRRTFAILINEHIGEFDYAGQINEGEYLIMYPHQRCEESKHKMDKLIKALKVRYFANLGEFSVNIGYSLDAPTVQDIDPYIFLSRLVET